jgi:hypothetical protein
MKFTAALSDAMLAASATAFAPSSTAGARSSLVALNAEKSVSLPYMNRPKLVSRKHALVQHARTTRPPARVVH